MHEFAAAAHVASADTLRAVVLVEGVSDRVALETLAARRDRDLVAEGVALVPMGGATNIRRFVELFGPRGRDVVLAGLCDAGEAPGVRRALQRAGLGAGIAPDDLEGLGFYVCVADLEDELIRALGADAVERVVETAGKLESFRTLQKQPAQRGRAVEEQLRRFLGSAGGRKIRFARLLVEALDLSRVPPPLDGVLERVRHVAA